MASETTGFATFQGLATKLGFNVSPFPSWKQRWFTVEGVVVSYFANKGDSKDKGSMELQASTEINYVARGQKTEQNATNTPIMLPDRSHMLEVTNVLDRGRDLRTFYLSFSSMALREQFAKCVRQNVRVLQAMQSGGASASASTGNGAGSNSGSGMVSPHRASASFSPAPASGRSSSTSHVLSYETSTDDGPPYVASPMSSRPPMPLPGNTTFVFHHGSVSNPGPPLPPKSAKLKRESSLGGGSARPLPPLPNEPQFSASVSSKGKEASLIRVSRLKEGYNNEDIYGSAGSVTRTSAVADDEFVDDDDVTEIYGTNEREADDILGMQTLRLSLEGRETKRAEPSVSAKRKESDKEKSPDKPALTRKTSRVEVQTNRETNFWADRPDVKPYLNTLDKKEIKRQESIHEFIVSEQAYVRDLKILISVYLRPLETYINDQIAAKKKAPIELDTVKRLLEVSQRLLNIGLCEDLESRAAERPVVGQISDIIQDHGKEMQKTFHSYSELAIETRAELSQATKDNTPKSSLRVSTRRSPVTDLKQFLDLRKADPNARGLQFEAYLLVPVQRLARYPLLLQAIFNNTSSAEQSQVSDALQMMTTTVKVCNERMRAIEDQLQIRDIEAVLDLTRLDDPISVSEVAKSLVKRGAAEIVKLEKNRVVKSQKVELMLFDTLFLFAKPEKNRNGQRRNTVYRQVHRSLLEAEQVNIEGQFIFGVAIFDQETQTRSVEYFRLPTNTDVVRWLEAFHPPKRNEEDIYQVWDAPMARVVEEYHAFEKEELTLCVGEIVYILNRGQDGYSKGYLKQDTPIFDRPLQGWFRTSCIEEIDSLHRQAKELKGRIGENTVSAL